MFAMMRNCVPEGLFTACPSMTSVIALLIVKGCCTYLPFLDKGKSWRYLSPVEIFLVIKKRRSKIDIFINTHRTSTSLNYSKVNFIPMPSFRTVAAIST